MTESQVWAWAASEAPDPRSSALMGAELLVSEPDEQDEVTLTFAAQVLAPEGVQLDAVSVHAVLLDEGGAPIGFLEGTEQAWRPGEVRIVQCCGSSAPLSSAVHTVEAYLQEVRFEVVPTQVAQQLGAADEDGSRDVQLYLRFDNPGSPCTAASAELVWELADGSPVAATTVSLSMVASGPQVHACSTHIALPRKASQAAPRGQVVMWFATSSGPYALGDDYPELVDEGPRGALRGDGRVEPVVDPREELAAAASTEAPPIRKKIPKQPERPKMLAPADLRRLAAAKQEEEDDGMEEVAAVPRAVDPRGAGRLSRPASAEPREVASPVPGRASLRDLIQTGQLDEALARIDKEGLEGGDRQEVSDLLDARDDALVIGGCQLAVRGGWSGVSTRLRRLLDHATPSVRAEAATALGALGGRSMVPALRRRTEDDDETVSAAATAAIARLMS